MSSTLILNGYDLTDEGPGRTVNEDATLVREDLGLFALADGAGGRGRGDVAANLALRTIENYVGSTVRSSHEKPDHDILGNAEQAKRLSIAVHRAHQNILEVIAQDANRAGMATTIVALLLAPRTHQVHIASVGDSRCYRLRHGRLELITVDDTIATDILQTRPDTSDEVLEQLPRNSVVRALGMPDQLRVKIFTLDLQAGDQFLLCSDGLTSYVSAETLWETMREPDPLSVVASELLSHALAARSQDNISVLVVGCSEEFIDDAVETRRYTNHPPEPVSHPEVTVDEGPSSAELTGPEIVAGGLASIDPDSLDLAEIEALEDWNGESDYPTVPLSRREGSGAFLSANASEEFAVDLLEPPPPTQSSLAPPAAGAPADLERAEPQATDSDPTPGSEDAPFSIDADELELEDEDSLSLDPFEIDEESTFNSAGVPRAPRND